MATVHRHTKTTKGGWHAAMFIIAMEAADRFAYQGLASNLITYFTNVLHQPIPVAVKNVNTWVGVSALIPLLGGFIADSYLGRFKTIIIASLIYILGMIFLTLSASVMKNEKLFFFFLYVVSIGDGGHKPCVQTFAADQFNDGTAEERHTISSFFNLWYLAIAFGSTSAVFVAIYVQDNVGWGVGLGVLAGVLGVALAVFLLGMKRFLDKATIIDEEDIRRKTKDPWRLCSMNQVDEVKQVLRLLPIWLSCLMFTAIQSLLGTFFVKQGATLVRSIGPHFQIPPASLQGCVGIMIFLSVPFYDRVFVPIARKITGHPSGITILQRIGTGLVLSILNMVISALVEGKRISVATNHNLLDHPNVVIPMSIWWMLPQYVALGVSDAFAIVGLQELFYNQMPETMRGLGAGAYLSVIGVGNFVSNFIIIVVQRITSRTGGKWLGNNINRAHINYFYWLMALLSVFNFCLYVWVTKNFVYKKIHDVAETSAVEDDA
ncbi:hypothetical protein VNO77_26765 [Canavalia gladiata]|uniref:Solute carrier family 15 member 1 n=1 Tax=Canavalia gladiata TaxID=3824 RepID=A0AAN9Q6K3_CANGL